MAPIQWIPQRVGTSSENEAVKRTKEKKKNTTKKTPRYRDSSCPSIDMRPCWVLKSFRQLFGGFCFIGQNIIQKVWRIYSNLTFEVWPTSKCVRSPSFKTNWIHWKCVNPLTSKRFFFKFVCENIFSGSASVVDSNSQTSKIKSVIYYFVYLIFNFSLIMNIYYF